MRSDKVYFYQGNKKQAGRCILQQGLLIAYVLNAIFNNSNSDSLQHYITSQSVVGLLMMCLQMVLFVRLPENALF